MEQGHTHEDIDARFSRISVQLKRRHATTLPDLLHVISDSVADGKLEPEMLPCVFDIKSWIKPCLQDIHNHSFPHIYRCLIHYNIRLKLDLIV